MLVVSIILEALVAIIAILAARKGKPYIYGLAFTFGAYVLYDLARLLQWDVQGGVLSGLFLLATITALIAVWGLYREERSDSRLEEFNHVETCLDRRARNADSRTRGGATGRDPGPSRHLERRERVDHPRDGQPASCRARPSRGSTASRSPRPSTSRTVAGSPARFPRRAATKSSSPRSRATTRFWWSTTMAIRSARSWRQTAWSGATCTGRKPRKWYPARS